MSDGPVSPGESVSHQERTVRYCPNCEAERAVIETVPWQDDICRECRMSVSNDASD